MKRFAALILALVMVLSLFPVTAWAEGEVLVEPMEASFSVSAEDFDISDEELFAAYAQREFDAALGYETPSFYRTSILEEGTLEKEIYDYLKVKIAEIAKGTVTSTVVTLTAPTHTWTAEDLGVSKLITGNSLTAEASDAIKAKLSLVNQCLLVDSPLDMYWQDKTQRTNTRIEGITLSPDLSTLSFGKIIYKFPVSEDYADKSDANRLTTDSAKTGVTSAAVANAKAIVAANASKSDLEKLKAYKNEICNLVSYNQSAASATNPIYGNPWQLIYVFDKNSSTNVVCEGYAKAFQYLCDLSTFSGDIECHTVSGTMSGGTGEGPHMWNVVTMDDGKNYLVDVTNCDSGTIGTPDKLFLAYTTNYTSAHQKHTFTIGSQKISFEYDASMKDLFCDGYLPLSTTAYIKPVTPTYEAQWGLATGANNDGKPSSWTKGTLANAMTYANGLTSGTAYIQLLTDVNTNAMGALKFDSGKTILDLNGKTIDRGLTAATENGSVIIAFGNLMLCDTSTNAATAPGKITGGYTTGSGGGVDVRLTGTLTMNGGAISDNTAQSSGGGVHVYDTFTMNGGIISGNTTQSFGGGVDVSDTFIMNGGTISGNTAQSLGGGGVRVDSTFTMNGGAIVANAANFGGGVYVHSSCTFTMNSGTISRNSTSSSGGGVYALGIFTMNGGTISDNTSEDGSGGVHVYDTFTMNGGTISGNTADFGGGVYVHSTSTFTMTAGTITGNTAQSYGGGVATYGTMMVSGKSVVSGNIVNGKPNNVRLTSGNAVIVLGELQDGASIGITTAAAPMSTTPVVAAQGSADPAYTLTASDAAKFTSDSGHLVEFDSANNAIVLAKKPGVTVSGTITSYLSDTNDVTVALFAAGHATADYTATVKGKSANFSIDGVSAGTYTMKVSKANHVTREYTVTVGSTNVAQNAKIHPKGDVTGDGNVNIIDVNRANLHYKNKSLLSGYEKLCADVTGEGSVNIIDVNRLNLHYKNKSLLW